MQFGRGKPSIGVFLDTGFNNMDEVLAQAVLYGMQGKGDCRVAVVTMSRPNLAVAGYADLVTRYYRGKAAVFAQVPPIGLPTAGQPGETSPAFTKLFSLKKPDGTPLFVNEVRRTIDTGDPCTLIRNYLEAQNDQNSIFVLAGPATNLAKAFALRGVKELFAQKMKYLVIADGYTADIPAAQKLLAEWPTPVYIMDGEVAKTVRFPGVSIEKEFVAENPDNPLIPAYVTWKQMPYDTPGSAMTAALYSIRPKEVYFKTGNPGTLTIANDGRATMTPSAQGRHQYITVDPGQKDAVVKALVELASAKPVIQQRFRPAAAADDQKKADMPEKKP